MPTTKYESAFESLGLSETDLSTVTHSLADTLGLSETEQAQLSRVLAENVTLQEALGSHIQKILAETLPMTETLAPAYLPTGPGFRPIMDLSEVVIDSDLSETFTICRTTGKFSSGGWIADPVIYLPAQGIVTVATPKQLETVPEGDRVSGAMAFYTGTRIYLTNASLGVISDQLTWNGEQWRVVGVSPWQSFGFTTAIAVRMAGD